MSRGFYQAGLPELMLCNLEVNEASIALFTTTLRQLQRGLRDQGSLGSHVIRLLTATKFTPIAVKGYVSTLNGKPQTQIFRGAVRKLDEVEERLLLAQLYEYGPESGLLTQEDVEGIMRYGVSVFETTDEKNRLPGQDGYNWKRISKIKTVHVLH
jgi:hypothetical protein